MNASSDLLVALRIAAGVLALPVTTWAVVGILAFFLGRHDAVGTIFTVIAATVATLLWWFTLGAGNASRRDRILRVALGGLLVGGVGFVAGFVGPVVWAPDANQGPLLGIFVTGPLGFAAGVLGTWIVTAVRRPRPAG